MTALRKWVEHLPRPKLLDAETDFEQILAIYWVDHPSPARIVGSYRMSSTLSTATTLAEARSTVRAFLAASAAKDVVFPYFGRMEVVEQREHRWFFEFQFPSDRPSRKVAFRIWKSSFLKPTTGWLLADADRTGSMSIGTVPKNIAAEDLVPASMPEGHAKSKEEATQPSSDSSGDEPDAGVQSHVFGVEVAGPMD